MRMVRQEERERLRKRRGDVSRRVEWVYGSSSPVNQRGVPLPLSHAQGIYRNLN